MTTIAPSIGRIVWYRGKDGNVRAAIVTRVHGDFCLNLYVFGLDGLDVDCCMKEDVTHADPEQEPDCLPSWHWMPYQVEQAKRHAASLAPLPAGGPFINLTFGDALVALKGGAKVARSGWNGKGLFVYLVPAACYPAQTGAAKSFFGDGGMVPYSAYLAVKNVDDTVSTWAPSCSDALAEDWLIVQ